jgi:general secretion pathway protein D
MERIDLPFRPHALALVAGMALGLAGTAHAAPKGNTQPVEPKVVTAPSTAAGGDVSEDDASLAPAKGKHGNVTLNFVNADIEAVSRAIGTMLGKEMLVDPRVKGTVTVYSDKPQPIWQAYRNYLASLRGLGFTVVDAGGMLKVVPEADAKLQSSIVSVGNPKQSGDQVLTQIYHLNYENPNNLVAVLRPLITANNTINASPGNNSLIITDYADNLQRLGKIIAALDQPAGAEVEVIPLKHALASDIVQTAQRLIEGGSTGGQPGVPGQASATSVIAEPRSNSMILRATNPARMNAAKAIIEKLDRPVEGGGPAGSIWVVYLKNSDATRMAELLRAAMAGNAGGGASGGSSSASTLSSSAGSFGAPNASANTPAGGNSTNPNSGGQSSAATTPVAAAARPSTGGQIQADPSTNSLIISAPEPLYRQLRSVIDQLDVRRAQIYVETLIVSVDAQKQAEMGIQWQGLFGTNGNNAFVGGGTNFGTGTNNIVNLSLLGGSAGSSTAGSTAVSVPGGLNVGFVPKINGIYTLAALAHFLETNVGGNVLSTPNLISLDNEEAKIVAGKNIGIPTGSYTASTTGSVNPFQTFDRKDVGITLRIKSQIGEGGTVRMTIFQENSDVDTAASASSAFGPTTTKNSIETNVVVDDGQLMVLGGLIRDEYSDNVEAVPILSSIPYLGNLFKSQTRTRKKSNLMVFLRPIVIRSQADADKLSVSRYDAIRSEQQDKQPTPSMVLGGINDAPVLPAIPKSGTFDKQVPVTPAPDVKK